MTKSLAAVSALLLAVAILLTGNGLQGTLLALRGDIEGFPTALIGALMASYFAGFIIGCRVNPGFIRAVGHIRTFVALASVASAATLIHALFVDPAAWAFLRGVTGFCFAGLIMIIESWLNERATNANRGQVLSAYRVVDLSATMVGNFLIATADPAGYDLFIITSILISIALVPVALTRSEAPQPIATAHLDLPRLLRTTPLAAVGAALIGLGNSAFWSMGAVYARELGYDKETIAAFVSAVVLGAAVSQWPIGWISDRIDRRVVMVATGASGAAAAYWLSRLAPEGAAYLLGLGALFGALIMPMFGLAAAHANDLAEPGTAVATNGGLLLLHGCGSVAGALLAGVFMSAYGPAAVFLYISAVYGVFGAYCAFRVAVKPPPSTDEKTPFSPVARNAAPTIFEIAEEDALPASETESEPA